MGQTRDYKSTIDSKSYSLGRDLQKDSGSVAEVLSHVPGVQVTPDGEVSLRGDADVTILVDGKPSALFSGAARAQALQATSAAQYERAEVMTNPSASQQAEGGGGIINLISKTPPKAGAAPTASGSIKAILGSGDRFDLGANGAYTNHALSLTGGVDLRRSGFGLTVGSAYGLPGPTGVLVPAQGFRRQDDRTDTTTIYGTAAYDLTPQDRAALDLSATSLREVDNQDRTYLSDAVAAPLAFDAPGSEHYRFASVSETLSYTHTAGAQTLTTSLMFSQRHTVQQDVANYAYVAPVQPALYQDLIQTADFPQLDFKTEYTTPVLKTGKLTVGYELRYDWQNVGNQALQGPAETQAAADPGFAQFFTFDQLVHAVYATYEQKIGKLTLQPGLRLEQAEIDTDLVTTGQRSSQRYFEAYPSAHVSYDLSDASQLKASYGRRVLRPGETQLDPFQVYLSPTLLFAGNPHLKPAFTNSFELGYEHQKGTSDFQVTAFLRDKSDLFTTVTQDVGGNVLLATAQNIGHGRDAGVELVVKHDLSRTLSVSGSTDVLHTEIDASNLGGLGRRSGVVASGQLNLNWRATRDDAVQLGGQVQARRLTAQGYVGGAAFANLGWRHTFTDRLAATLTASDPFGLPRRTVATDTPTLTQIDKRKYRDSTVMIGLTYAFGGKGKAASNTFDFGAQPQAGP